MQASIYFQIMEKSGPIPWDDIELPEGRTKRAVEQMISKEKIKAKKAREAEGNGNGKVEDAADGGSPAAPKASATPITWRVSSLELTASKRKTKGETGGAAKKTRTPRKKKSRADDDEVANADGNAEVEADEAAEGVKAEPGDDTDDA